MVVRVISEVVTSVDKDTMLDAVHEIKDGNTNVFDSSAHGSDVVAAIYQGVQATTREITA